ncbi:hypothetical protein [Mycolicibacterium septicum]|uniref:hypothetical protein n=1 Tax=Mycolicibacterium septicum TaxID=98668 RepID=UPI001AF7FC51|nr:hypothetical protein [Mycolicibacterium septicum]QRY51745.1 hypothetical protein JVX95_30965 [Mycolicibacterium septicum]
MSLIKGGAPQTRNPWIDSEYLEELLEEIRAASTNIETLTADHETNTVRLVPKEPWTAQEFNRFHKYHWPIEVGVE